MPSRQRYFLAAAALAAGPALGHAQTEPVNGIRPSEVRTHAIVGATVVIAPGRRIEDATIVIRDGVIQAAGSNVEVPAGARWWPAEGLTVYAGLIDAAVMVDLADGAFGTGEGAHWSARVHPEVSMAEQPGPGAATRETLRGLGFTAAAVYPSKGIFRGSGAVIALADDDQHVLSYDDHAAMAVGFDYRDRSDRTYPRSLMGAIAMIRQTLYDAQWHAMCVRIWREDPAGHEPPARADALAALADVIIGRQPVQFDVSDEHDALRAARLAEEFELEALLLGSGLEFRRLDEILATGLPVIVPLNYPQRPAVSSPLEADDVSLREMMTWEQAPTNPRRLLDAGATVALTTHRLTNRGDFPAALAKAIAHGLAEDEALAALTTTPAALLGLDDVMGTIEAGKVANLVVVEGSLFEKKPKIRDTWINGRRYEISNDGEHTFAGEGTLTTSTGAEASVTIDTTKAKVSARMPGGKNSKASTVVVQHDRLSFMLDGGLFDAEGYVRLTGLMTGGRIVGTGVLPDGGRFTFTITPATDTPADAPADTDELEANDPMVVAIQPAGAGDADPGEDDDEDDAGQDTPELELPPDELVVPLGAYGFGETPRPRNVLITNATIWTCGSAGILEDAALYVRDGRIVSVGRAPGRVPADVTVIDAAGRHVTPGLIDCHSHTGISGGGNEMGQAVTAEVRIRDVVNPDDINFYRALAGGLTTANVLHGSANPIGGQNNVIKLKWSAPAGDFHIDTSPEGIKFALGENVKRSESRYPNTRMGVEAIIRDSFSAAEDYREQWERYAALPRAERQRSMPPRRDLELDALVEILEGERLVHCHSYRQDEILMLIRVADELGFTIGTFQHVLEGYKVAEAIAAHGAGASSFSDWWAYKVEVMDAIPFNGALMHEVGVLVSFNSDSSELARRMNTEAAKAVRYGGMDPVDALGLVTLNPARQLGINDRTGSLEPGKDADFVIWSESPLSTYARCEQTWIEGVRYFDLETDRELRLKTQSERRRLEQKILADAHGKPKTPPEPGQTDHTEPQEPTGLRPSDDVRPYSCCWSLDR